MTRGRISTSSPASRQSGRIVRRWATTTRSLKGSSGGDGVSVAMRVDVDLAGGEPAGEERVPQGDGHRRLARTDGSRERDDLHAAHPAV